MTVTLNELVVPPILLSLREEDRKNGWNKVMTTINVNTTANRQPHHRSITSSVMERWLLAGFGWVSGLPIITLAFAVIALVAAPSQSLSQWFTLERTALGDGEAWRLFTGHLAHWSAEHLFWDVAMFTTLGVLCERRDRMRFVFTLIASALAISLGFLVLCPQFETYRGLSGIDCALMALYLTMMWRSGALDVRGKAVMFILGLGFAAKITWEMSTGGAIFVHSDAMTPVPESHAIGAVVGLFVGFMGRRRGHA